MTPTDRTLTDETIPDDSAVETVTVTVAVDDIIELFELLAFCHKLCAAAPDDLNAAITPLVVNGYNAKILGAELDDVFRRLYATLR